MSTQVIQQRDGTILMGKQEDCAPVLAENKLDRQDNVFSPSKKMHRVASIPNVLVDKWCREWGCTMHQMMSEPEFKLKLYRRLNDPEWRALRTDEGRL